MAGVSFIQSSTNRPVPQLFIVIQFEKYISSPLPLHFILYSLHHLSILHITAGRQVEK